MSVFDVSARIDRTGHGLHPLSEPVRGYAPASPERTLLELRLKELAAAADTPLTMTIGGTRRLGGGERVDVVQPHHHSARLGVLGSATAADVGLAVDAALAAAPDWRAFAPEDRAAVFLKAAELLAGPWRETAVAATMLGQSMTAEQAEADVCALVDAWRHAVALVWRAPAERPVAEPSGGWSRTDLRPLEGFVCAVTPFDSTATAGRLASGPVLTGTTVVWKPASAQTLSAGVVLRVLEAAGLPPGVINTVTGGRQALVQAALSHPALAGVHFAGPAPVFHSLWCEVGRHLDRYARRPRLVGETSGRGFVLAHPGADPAVLRNVLLRGAFDYQGQRRSAASSAYVPRGLWQAIKTNLLDEVRALTVGDVADLSNRMGALIGARAHERSTGAIARARSVHSLDVVAGGHSDDAIGWFVEPTVITGTDPRQELFSTEQRGPLLAVHVYEDARWDQVLDLVASGPTPALTGSVVAEDRAVIARATARLRFAADALHVNAPGAVRVGPEGELLRWVSRRSVQESLN